MTRPKALSAAPPEAIIAVAFALAAVAVGLSGRLPDDEGYLTYLGARLVAREPLAGVFFQKIHPSASAFYAPFAALGWRAFLVAHALTAGAAVYLLGVAARRWSTGPAWLPPLVLVCSPLYLVSAATGQSNSFAVFLFVAVLTLLDGPPAARALAGALAAAGLWSRYEQAPYFFALVGFDVFYRRRAHAALGFASVVALYLLAGALYHGSALWLVSRPPVLLRETAPTTMTELALGREGVASLLVGLSLVTPLWGSAAMLRRGASTPMLRCLALTLGLALCAQLALPRLGRLFNFDYTARYFLCHLPAVALLAGAYAGDPSPSRPRAVALALAAAALSVELWGTPFATVAGPLAVSTFALALLPRRGWTLAGIALALALAAPVMGWRHTSARPTPGLDAALDAVLRAPRGTAVYTNAHNLQALIDARGASVRARFLAGYDIVIELGEELGGRRSAQSDAVFRALRPMLYGRALWPCDFPHRPPVGSLLVLTRDPRVREVYALDPWIAASERVLSAASVEVWRLRSPVTVPRREPPAYMSRSTFELPCVDGTPP